MLLKEDNYRYHNVHDDINNGLRKGAMNVV